MSTPTTQAKPLLAAAEMQAIYRRVALIRGAEQAIAKQLRSGKISFSFYPVTGQELAPSVLAQCLGTDDQMVTIYRGLADTLARGLPLRDLLAECIGHSTGVCGGKGGGMGVARADLGLMMTTGIVGSSAPVGVGLALASQLQKTGKVVTVSFGDGATSIGAVHEAMLFASLWKLPIIFVCHNNGWSESTPLSEYSVLEKLAERADGYRMPGVTVSGRDPQALASVFNEAIDRARSGNGPTFVESTTYRLCGHYFADAGAYMNADELAAEKARDPVPALRAQLIADGHASEAELEALDADIAAEVARDIATVLETPVAPFSEADLLSDVYQDPKFEPISRIRPDAQPVPTGPMRKATMRDAFNEALMIAMEQDDQVIMLGEDIADPASGVVGISRGLSTRFGDRVRSTPIAEQGIFGACVGAGLVGMKPVGELLMMDFLPVAMDQMVNHAAKARYMTGGQMSVPMTMMTLVGAGNGAQHSQSTEAWLMHTPGLKVCYPNNPTDAKGMLLSAIFDPDPVVLIHSMLNLFGTSEMPEGEYRIPLGLAAIRRIGTDVTIISYGPAVGDALKAADALMAKGINAEVIDLRSLVPLDGQTVLESVAKTGRAVIAHRAVDFMGPAAEISALIYEELFGKLKAPVQRVAGAYAPVPKHAGLLGLHYKGADAIVKATQEIMK
ncbi:2-oxoisovalerate dehydrogenase E1 component [Pseudomonas sp. 9AZ]|uniref:alpha-ketoacid dehydrogenase subunit alpha/beta n=1 Tax=Pseudomonas sp. 9AZ TaxID=2653168 RepID=UPI0012F11788|nr:alpha-ketoacid dehydrogenase subunit alpha/beta [Pseudomonas sp. 9AZ]VXD04399.1 2-oxoisovalerate dehydrogenase E1 component [Pseudomonas sp. 9AZ]